MTTETRNTIRILEDVLYAWACGMATAAATQMQFKAHGWRIDLRQRDVGAGMEAFAPDGSAYWLEV